MRHIPVKTRLIFALGVILMISFVVTSIVNYTLSRDSIRREIMNSSLPLTSENLYSQIHGDLLKPINVASLMANDTFLRDWALHGEKDHTKINQYLSTIQRRYGYFAAFFVSAKTANYYYPGGILKKISTSDQHDVWFYNFVHSGLEYDLDVDVNEAKDNNLTIFINYRLEDPEGNLLGVTGVGLEMDRVATLLKVYQRTYDRSIYLVDRQGLVQAHTDTSKIEHESILAADHPDQALKRVLTPSAEPRQYQTDRDGHHLLLSVRYIPEFNWFLVVEQDERLALSTARSNLFRTLLVGLFASLVILVLTVISLNHYQRRLENMASTDELTGVANRREFATQYRRAVHRCERQGTPFSVLLVDIDNLKEVNDTLGHLAGDDVIREVCAMIGQTIRGEDVVARWGGDEFIVLVEGGEPDAVCVAERIRENVAEALLPRVEAGTWNSLPVSVSCGVTEFQPNDDLDQVTMRADKAMYTAKRGGKNAVCVFEEG